MQTTDGILMILPRTHAKDFFGLRDDASRKEFMRSALENRDLPKLDLGGQWQDLDVALAGVELEDSVLTQAILGGREMYAGDDAKIVMVRPDVSAFIADQLARVDLAALGGNLEPLAESVAQHYQHAAEQRAAMVFVSGC